MVYNTNMIKSFKHKGLKKFFEEGSVKGINPNHATKLSWILSVLDNAENIDDVNFPGSRLHPYTNSDLWSVDISGNWRILFEFRGKDVYVVDYLDPHKK
jgi:proteic killer suppression protein